jgi:hypothetical protein
MRHGDCVVGEVWRYREREAGEADWASSIGAGGGVECLERSAGGGVAYVAIRVGANVVVRVISAALVAIPARSVLVFFRSLFIVDVVVVVECGAVGGTVGVRVLAKIVVWLPIRVARVLV